MKYYSIGNFAKLIGKTEQTLRNGDKTGTLKPAQVVPSGFRYYSQEQLNHYRKKPKNKRRTRIGRRFSTNNNSF